MYQEIKPSAGLHHFIDSFWTYSNNETCERFKVLPDTCTDLIFDLNQNKGFISGIMTNFQFQELATASNLIGIRFKTENFGSLSKIPLNETKNLRLELSELFPVNKLAILNQMNDFETISDKLSFLENFIAVIFEESDHQQDKMVLWVAESIRSLKGNINVSELAKSNHISLRQLERRFKTHIGLTMKEFSSIVRFNYAKKAIKSFSDTSLLEIAYDTGFFDHAHMNNEFNRISGENPSYFR